MSVKRDAEENESRGEVDKVWLQGLCARREWRGDTPGRTPFTQVAVCPARCMGGDRRLKDRPRACMWSARESTGRHGDLKVPAPVCPAHGAGGESRPMGEPAMSPRVKRYPVPSCPQRVDVGTCGVRGIRGAVPAWPVVAVWASTVGFTKVWVGLARCVRFGAVHRL